MTLDPAEVAGMRATLVRTQLDMVCTIQRRDVGLQKDPDGHPIYTWSNLYTDVACHYWEETNLEEFGIPTVTITRERLLLEARTDVRVTDRVTEVLSVDGEPVAGLLDIEEVLQRLNDVILRVKGIK